MRIYPTLELLGGQCVTLDRGRIEHPLIWHVDPVETALDFAAAGAEWMHLTDFDAVEGREDNSELVEEIIRKVGIPVQLAGGFRSRDRVERWIDKGAGRIVIGTVAALDPPLALELAKYHPDQIVLSVDIWRGQVMTEGWRKASALAPETFLSAFAAAPLAGVILTDIDSDIGDFAAHLEVISELATFVRVPAIASGVVRGIADIEHLKRIPGIDGALVGRALFRKTINLGEALEMAGPSFSHFDGTD